MNQVPSKVMTTNYNSRIAKFVKYKEKDIESWTIGEEQDDGLTEVDVHMCDGVIRKVYLKRYELQEQFTVPESGMIELSPSFSEYGYIGELQESVAEACDIRPDDVEQLYSIEFKHTLLFWINYGVFVPPQDITVTLSRTQDDTSYPIYLVEAAPDSLGYKGAVTTIIKENRNQTPPTTEVVNQKSLSGLYYNQTASTDLTWNKPVNISTPEELQFFIDDVLERLNNGDGDVSENITEAELNFEVVPAEDSTDVVVTPKDTSLTSRVKDKFTYHVRSRVPFNLMEISNTDTPGKIKLALPQGFNTNYTRDKVQLLLTKLNEEYNDKNDYIGRVYINESVISQSAVVNPDDPNEYTYTVTPPANATEYHIIGELKVQLNVAQESDPQVPQFLDLNNIVWLYPDKQEINEDTGEITVLRDVPAGYVLEDELVAFFKEVDDLQLYQMEDSYIPSGGITVVDYTLDGDVYVMTPKYEHKYSLCGGRVRLKLVETPA